MDHLDRNAGPYRAPATPAPVYCPLCGVPHLATAVRCDGCDHVLAEPVDVDLLRAELDERKLHIAFALASLAAMLALNAFVLGGGFVIVFAPIGWLLYSLKRWSAVRRYLARQQTFAKP